MNKHVTSVPAQDNLSPRQRGDFQTPHELARLVWSLYDAGQYDIIIEPTFGLGSFLMTVPDDCRAAIIGWEIDECYARIASDQLRNRTDFNRFRLMHGDVFCATSSQIPAMPNASVLVIGNPPWVTNAEQGTLGGRNTGKKHNLKALGGLDAMTGKSNFDISEAILL